MIESPPFSGGFFFRKRLTGQYRRLKIERVNLPETLNFARIYEQGIPADFIDSTHKHFGCLQQKKRK